MKPASISRQTDRRQSVWLDGPCRQHIEDGTLAELIDGQRITGITPTPVSFERAIQDTLHYEAMIRVCGRYREDADTIRRRIVIDEVQAAADLLATTYTATAFDEGYVSVPVDPALAHDAAAMIAQAQALWTAIARPNLMVAVPATAAGLSATQALIAEGINVNVTLIAGAQSYIAAAEACCDGLSQRIDERRRQILIIDRRGRQR